MIDTRARRGVLLILALTLPASPAVSQPADVAPPPSPTPAPTPAATASPAEAAATSLPSAEPKWTVQIEPSFWYVAPSGKVKLPSNSGTGTPSTPEGDSVELGDLNLDSPRFEPTGEIHFSGGRLRFTFSGATYSIHNDDTIADTSFQLGAVAAAPGDSLDVKFDFTTVELTGGYCVWGRVFSDTLHTERPENAIETIGRLYIIGGGRFYNTSFDVTDRTGTTASAEADQFFGEPVVGVRVEADLAQDFTLDLQFTAGGLPLSETSSYSVDIQTGFQWRPHPNIGLQIGYRQLAYWLSDGEDAEKFEYNGRLAGLFAGLVIRF